MQLFDGLLQARRRGRRLHGDQCAEPQREGDRVRLHPLLEHIVEHGEGGLRLPVDHTRLHERGEGEPRLGLGLGLGLGLRLGSGSGLGLGLGEGEPVRLETLPLHLP